MNKLTEHEQLVVNNILTGLKASLESCEHQANCIEAHNHYSEDPPEEHMLHPETKELLTLDDKWDVNDEGNWTCMADNIRQAITFLSQLK